MTTTTDASARTRELVDHAFACLSDPARREEYLDLYDPAVVAHGDAPVPLDRAGLEAMYRASWAAFPDAVLRPQQVLVDGDRAAVRWRLQGTHLGAFMGVEPTGRAVAAEGTTIVRLRDDRVVERWSSFDVLGLLMQIGAIPAPA